MKNCSLITKPSDRCAWTKCYKIGDNYHGHGQTTWFPREVGVKTVRYSSSVICNSWKEKACTHAALCSFGYVASAAASKLRGQLSVSDIATHLKKGSVQPSRSAQAVVSDVQHTMSWQLFSIQTTDNKTAANEMCPNNLNIYNPLRTILPFSTPRSPSMKLGFCSLYTSTYIGNFTFAFYL